MKIIYEKKEKKKILNKIKRYIAEILINKYAEKYIQENKQIAIFSFDYISNQIIVDGLYEKDELNILIEWLIKINNDNDIFKGVVCDIGANIGNHSLFFSDYFEKIYSFEPHPLTYKLLEINTNIEKKIKIYNYGISNKNINNHKPLIIFEQQKNDFTNNTSKVIELIKKYGYVKFAIINKNKNDESYSDNNNLKKITKLIKNESLKIIEVNKFEQKFYPFIIAIPNWIKL